jgi:hypothetical protein
MPAPRPQLQLLGARPSPAVASSVAAALRGPRVVVVECYPGVRAADVHAVVDWLGADLVLDVSKAYLRRPSWTRGSPTT